MAVKNSVFSLSIVLALAVHAQAAVTGSWTNTGNNYKFGVTSDLGNITSLELKFVPSAGSTFAIEFDDIIFDADGLLAGISDSFMLFPGSVTSPGATQGKSPNLLQAAFTGFTPFTSKNVAQLIVNGAAAIPTASNIAGTGGRLGTAVVETIAGDPNSRQEFPISGFGGDTTPPVVTPLLVEIQNPLFMVNRQLQATDDTPPITWSDLKMIGPGKLFEGASNPTVSSSGEFHWNAFGWRRGRYDFTFDVSDGEMPPNTANDALALTVVWIPEPATATLLGLAAIGFVVSARRRSETLLVIH